MKPTQLKRPASHTGVVMAMAGVGRRLLGVVAFPEMLGQHIGRIAAAGGSKATQLFHVAPLARSLDELVHGVRAAGAGKTAQLVHVTALGSQLDELVDGIPVPDRGTRSEVEQLTVSHAATPAVDRTRFGRPATEPRPNGKHDLSGSIQGSGAPDRRQPSCWLQAWVKIRVMLSVALPYRRCDGADRGRDGIDDSLAVT